MNGSAAVALLLALVWFGCPGAAAGGIDLEHPDARSAGMNPERLAEIPRRMQEFVEARRIAGTVTMVVRHGQLASLETVGFQDVESRKPMRKDTLFRIASLTKPITCAGIMVLVDRGKLAVIDPVERYLPEYRGQRVDACGGQFRYGCRPGPPLRPINIEDLMMHTSGLSPDAGETTPAPQTLAELAVLGAKMPLLFQPGTAWKYSNVGYDILGRIIEIVSGQPYEEFLQKSLFEPLGMKDTAFFPAAGSLPRLATLYTRTEAGLERAAHQFSLEGPHVPKPAGGLISTAEDVMRFNLMMHNQGSWAGKHVLSAAAVALMTTSHTGEMKAGWVPGVGHGYGYEVVRNAEGMFRYNSIGSFAKGGAYRTYEFVDPEKDLVGVFMMQLTNGGGDVADEINRFLAISAAAIE